MYAGEKMSFCSMIVAINIRATQLMGGTICAVGSVITSQLQAPRYKLELMLKALFTLIFCNIGVKNVPQYDFTL